MKLTFAPHLHGANFSLESGLAQTSLSPLFSGGEGGIRTHGTRKGSTVFETARFNRSRTSPCLLRAFAIVAALVFPPHSELPFSRPKRCVSIEMLSWAARPTRSRNQSPRSRKQQ